MLEVIVKIKERILRIYQERRDRKAYEQGIEYLRQLMPTLKLPDLGKFDETRTFYKGKIISPRNVGYDGLWNVPKTNRRW